MSKRLALVGCGGIATAHALAAQALGAACCRIVALSDVDAERANRFRQEFAPHALSFTDLEPMLREVVLDAVLLCTPPATHAPLATLCLERGLAVMCEKPLASQFHPARELVALAQERGAVLRTSAKYRFVDGVLAAKRCVLDGTLDNILRLNIAFGAPTALAGRWHLDAALSGGGVLMDNGPHALDLARFLLGNLDLVDVELRHEAKYAVEDEASLHLQSTTGVPVFIELSWLRTLGSKFLQIQGESGRLDVGWNATVWHPNTGPVQNLAGPYDKNRAFARQLDAFLAALEAESETENQNDWGSDDGAHVVELIMVAYRQAKK